MCSPVPSPHLRSIRATLEGPSGPSFSQNDWNQVLIPCQSFQSKERQLEGGIGNTVSLLMDRAEVQNVDMFACCSPNITIRQQDQDPLGRWRLFNIGCLAKNAPIIPLPRSLPWAPKRGGYRGFSEGGIIVVANATSSMGYVLAMKTNRSLGPMAESNLLCNCRFCRSRAQNLHKEARVAPQGEQNRLRD